MEHSNLWIDLGYRGESALTSLEDVWAGRDGLLEEVYRLRRENLALIEDNLRLKEVIEKVSPFPKRMV